MVFRCFNGTNNCDYCGSCHSEFKARTSDEKRRIYNQAIDDFVENISLPMTEKQIGEIVEKLKR